MFMSRMISTATNNPGQPQRWKCHQQRIQNFHWGTPLAQGTPQILAEAALRLCVDFGDDRNKVPGLGVQVLPCILEEREVMAQGVGACFKQVVQRVTRQEKNSFGYGRCRTSTGCSESPITF